MEQVFYIGNTFSIPVRFELDGVPIEITGGMEFYCSIANVKCEIIAEAVVTPYSDQVLNKGFLNISVADTSTWEQGVHTMDIKYVLDGNVKNSQSLQFKVKKGITP